MQKLIHIKAEQPFAESRTSEDLTTEFNILFVILQNPGLPIAEECRLDSRDSFEGYEQEVILAHKLFPLGEEESPKNKAADFLSKFHFDSLDKLQRNFLKRHGAPKVCLFLGITPALLRTVDDYWVDKIRQEKAEDPQDGALAFTEVFKALPPDSSVILIHMQSVEEHCKAFGIEYEMHDFFSPPAVEHDESVIFIHSWPREIEENQMRSLEELSKTAGMEYEQYDVHDVRRPITETPGYYEMLSRLSRLENKGTFSHRTDPSVTDRAPHIRRRRNAVSDGDFRRLSAPETAHQAADGFFRPVLQRQHGVDLRRADEQEVETFLQKAKNT